MRSSESVHGVGSGSLDARITEHVFSRFCSLKSIPRDAVSRRSLARLRGAVERAKLVLSTIADAKIEVEAFHEGIDLSFPISRASVAEICSEDFASMRAVVSRALDAAGIADLSKGALEAVEIVCLLHLRRRAGQQINHSRAPSTARPPSPQEPPSLHRPLQED